MTAIYSDTKELAISEIYTFKGYSVFMRHDHIIQLQFEEDGFYGDLDDAKNMMDTFRKLNNGTRHALIVIYQENNMFSKEVREYIAQKEISDEILLADALVIKGLALKILGNAYLKINKPTRPTALFTNQEDALKWLRKVTL
ncbi:MAG: hypothetical protein JWP12_2649 [Bacteroidetes bacterium]|nr:hypothetical protein [Bacteroidota bacterium]